MLVLGDVHASDPENLSIVRTIYREVDPDATLQVGDLQCYELPAPTWFVAGNNEDFDVIDALRRGSVPTPSAAPTCDAPHSRRGERPPETENVHLLASTAADVDGIRVAGLSGNYAPTKYDLAREELEGERRRHFTREDVDRAADLEGVDVFLTHEAPTNLLSYGYDPGCERVDDLIEAVSPDLCLVGHHHKHRETELGETRVVSLAPVWEGYYLLDPDDLSLERRELPGEAGE